MTPYPARILATAAMLTFAASLGTLSKRIASPEIPVTSFSCEGRHNGYYADVETDCQVYHMCLGREQFSYLCPNTTRFQQRMMVCDHWYQVDCPSAPLSYSANLLIGQRDKPFVGDDEHRKIHEAALRTSKGLLKNGDPRQPKFSSIPDANQNQLSSIQEKADKRPFVTPTPSPSPPPSPQHVELLRTTKFKSAPSPSPTPIFKPSIANNIIPPSTSLEAPFFSEEERVPFFQRASSSSFAQPFQNHNAASSPQKIFSPAPPSSAPSTLRPSTSTSTTTTTQAPPIFPTSPLAPSQPAPFSPPLISGFSPSTTPIPVPTTRKSGSTFTYTFPSSPPSSSFTHSFNPSPSFPASGHNLQHPSSPSAYRVPSRELEAPDFPPSTPVPVQSNNAPRTSKRLSSTSQNAFSSSTAQNAFPSSTSQNAFPSSTSQNAFPSSSSQNAFSSSTSQNAFPSEGIALNAPVSSNSIIPPSRDLLPPEVDAVLPVPQALRSLSYFNTTSPRFSLFAATQSPPVASPSTIVQRASVISSTPQPPSSELIAPDESDENFNTVEVKFQDPRRLFFIPNSPGQVPKVDSNPVVVIKYPTSGGIHSRSTMRLKSYSSSVKERTSPACPRCHPDFVVPGTCKPCVLLR